MFIDGPPRQSPLDGLAPAESVPEDRATHCLRSAYVPLRDLRLWMHRVSLIVRATQRQAARVFPGARMESGAVGPVRDIKGSPIRGSGQTQKVPLIRF